MALGIVAGDLVVRLTPQATLRHPSPCPLPQGERGSMAAAAPTTERGLIYICYQMTVPNAGRLSSR